jgi:formylglycine-generating enzyme required for sulfatase activity
MRWLLAVWGCVIGGCGRHAPAMHADAELVDAVDAPDAPFHPPAHCSDLPPTCGPSGTTSCCGSPLIAGGMYYRGYDAAGAGNMMHPATVSDFRLDIYEVTVARFRQFVDAGLGTQLGPPTTGAGAHPNIASSGWDASWTSYLPPDSPTLRANLRMYSDDTWTDSPGANENLPINNLTWYEAFAFCAFDGGYLPSEAEWNYAAAAGAEQRAYPWSNPASSVTIDCTYANSGGTGNCVSALPYVNRVGTDSATGDGAFGQADLSGNVSEWTLDAFATYIDPCTDCAELTTADTSRVVRGGSYMSLAGLVRTSARSGVMASTTGGTIGVRCARAP